MEDAGAAAVAVHGRTAAQSYSGSSDWDLIARVAGGVQDSGVRQRRLRRAGAARGAAAWMAVCPACWSAAARCAIRGSSSRRPRSRAARRRARSRRQSAAQFLLDYIDLLLHERTGEAEGFRHVAPTSSDARDHAGRRADTIAG